MSMIPAAAISFLILSMTSRAVLSQLSTADFYIDTDATVLVTETGTGESTVTALPLPIANLKGFQSVPPANRFLIRKGEMVFLSTSNILQVTVLVQISSSVLTEGEATLSVSTDATLLTRALNDITAVYGSVVFIPRPTHLLIFTNIDIRASSSIQGTTFQLVTATNGQYSYGILQFVSVEPAAAMRDVARLRSTGVSTSLESLPYSSNVTEATTLSNTGTEGKYVLDLNEVPPPSCPSFCKNRLLLLVCEALKQRNFSPIPAPCNE